MTVYTAGMHIRPVTDDVTVDECRIGIFGAADPAAEGHSATRTIVGDGAVQESRAGIGELHTDAIAAFYNTVFKSARIRG